SKSSIFCLELWIVMKKYWLLKSDVSFWKKCPFVDF
ncbi:MAG: hypothetical protein ACJART_002966, partial [Maribacter sp.]